MAMNRPARLCPRSAFGPVSGDDRAIMSSRSPTVSRGVGFVKFEWISTFYSSSSGIIKDLARFLTLDAETLQSGIRHIAERWLDPYAWQPGRTRDRTWTGRRRLSLRRRDGTRDLSRLHRSLFRLCAGVRALRGCLYRHDRDGELRSVVPRLLGTLLGLLRLYEPWLATRGRGLPGLCPRV